jgi:hypothetical protein
MTTNNKFKNLFAFFPFSIFDLNYIPETSSSFSKFLFSLMILAILTL